MSWCGWSRKARGGSNGIIGAIGTKKALKFRILTNMILPLCSPEKALFPAKKWHPKWHPNLK
jgi:hypothetical protein